MTTLTNISLRTRIGVGAAAVLTAGALIGAGVSVSSASTTAAPSATAHANAQTKTRHSHHSLSIFLKFNANSPQVLGDRAVKVATALADHPHVFAKLPAALQTDVSALRNAAPADRVKDAYKIKTTALSGGYGAGIQKRAENLQKTGTKKLDVRRELRTVVQSATPGAGMEKIADQLIGRPKLFAKIPANLQSDLKTLKAAAPAALDAQASKILATARNGGYGTRIQKMIQHLEVQPAPATVTHS